MVKIKLELVGDGDESDHEKQGEKRRSHLKFFNPFRFLKKKSGDEILIDDSPDEDLDERPEGWVHPPFP